jgi:hypothetical protein
MGFRHVRSVLFVLAVAITAVVAAGTAAGAGAGTVLARVPVTGTTSGGVFAGTYTITDFAVRGGDLVAIGDLADAAGNTIAADLVAPVQTQQAACTLVGLSIGAVDVNVVGLVVVHLDPVALDVGLDGLIGTLLCGLLGGVLPAPPAGG